MSFTELSGGCVYNPVFVARRNEVWQATLNETPASVTESLLDWLLDAAPVTAREATQGAFYLWRFTRELH